MAHPATEAASSPAPVSVAEKAADFEEYLFDDGDPFADEEQEETDEDAEPDEGDEEPEVDEDDEEQDEPAEPAIEPPVSLNAEEKTVFSQLPPEAQRAWAASETRRNQQVQEATTNAREAQRTAEAVAASAERQAEARFAVQLKSVAQAIAPQEPNPADFQTIQQFQHAKANYDYAKAQHDQFVQQVATIGVETPEQKAARIQARDQQLLTIPEVADPATRGTFIQSAFEVAELLGYDKSDLAENMDVGDLKALAQAAKWKADSEELARIRAKSSERIRDKSTGKFRSMKPGAAPHGDPRRGNRDKAWQKVKQSKGNRAQEGAAMADWLEANGHL
jgi:hypothetical protein